MYVMRTVASVVTAGAVAVATAGAAAAGPSGAWTQYRTSATKNAHAQTPFDEIFTGAITTDDQVRATPVVADGKIFVGNHDSGVLQAFDLNTGEQLWQAQAPNWVHSEMLYSNGRVFVGFGNRFDKPGADGVRGSGDSGVMSLDAGTGKVLWTHETEGEVMPTPALVNGALYAVTGDRNLYELDPVDGTLIEKTWLGHIVSMSSPAVHNGVLYFGGGAPDPYTFFAYDTAAGDFAWQRPLDRFNMGLDDVPPAVADGIVVTTGNRIVPPLLGSVGDVREKHSIIAMDADTGEVLWQDVLGVGPRPVNNRSGAPMIHDGKVFVGSPTTDSAYGYDLHTGERLWQKPAGAIKAAPVAEGGTVYFATKAGEVLALDENTGEMTGKLELDGTLAPAGPVIVDDEYLVVPSQSHHVNITRLDAIPPASWGPAAGLGGSWGSAGSLGS